jgi:hypothetical protein
MKKIVILLLFMSSLTRAGVMLSPLPLECSYKMDILLECGDGTKLAYNLDCHKKGSSLTHAVWTAPEIMLNDTVLMHKETVFFKYAKWPRIELMGLQAPFADSSFTWEVLFESSGGTSYRLDGVTTNLGRILTKVVPESGQSFSAINVENDRISGQIIKKMFLSPTGEPIIEVEYSDIRENSYQVVMHYPALHEKLTVFVHDIIKADQPDSMFDPSSLGYKARRR